MKAKKPDLKPIYVISALEMTVFLLLMPLIGRESSDTATYFSAWDTLLTGSPDSLRTPLYPIFVGSLRAMFGARVGALVALLVQCTLFLFSIRWFAHLAEAISGNGTIARWATAVYALYPGPLTLNCALLTESFALSGTTGLLLLTHKALTRGNNAAAAGAGAVTCALVMLRPALIFMPLLLGLFWLIAVLRRKASVKTCLISMGGCAAALIILAGYCTAMKNAYGIAAPSSVSAINNYFTARGAGAIDPQAAPTPQLRHALDSITTLRPLPGTADETWSEVAALSRLTTPAEMAELTSGAISAHPVETLRHIISVRLPEAVSDDAVYGGTILPPVRALTKLIGVNIGGALALMLLFAVMLLRHDLRHHSLSIEKWLIAALFLATAATAIVGAQGEWQRLILPAYPALLIVASCVLARATTLAKI